MLKHQTAALFFCAAVTAPFSALAQNAPPQPVNWELQVLQDGQQIDSFSGTTNVGQARTDTHHHVVKNSVGCADKPAGDIDLQRTLTLSPIHANDEDVTLADRRPGNPSGQHAPVHRAGLQAAAAAASGSATHPGLVLKPGEWSTLADRR